MVDTWADDTGAWGDANAAYAQKFPVMVKDSAFYSAESGELRATDESMLTVLERTGLTISGQDSKGLLLSDPSVVKLLHGLWPIIIAPVGTVINVYAGAQDTPGGAVRWANPQVFTVGNGVYVDFYQVTGPYLAVRFTSLGQATWKLLGYDLDIELVGEH